MFDSLERLADKILPDVVNKQKEHKKTTDEVVEKSKEARDYSRVAVEEAYRLADEAYSRRR